MGKVNWGFALALSGLMTVSGAITAFFMADTVDGITLAGKIAIGALLVSLWGMHLDLSHQVPTNEKPKA